MAEEVTVERLEWECKIEDYEHDTITVTSTLPERTLRKKEITTENRVLRELLWEELPHSNGGKRRECPGCDRRKYFDDFHLDHIQPKSRGGNDTDGNKQLLCGACNIVKGNRLTMAELRTRNGV